MAAPTKKAPGQGDATGAGSPRVRNKPTKLTRVLEALARGESFNRFEAERQLHDHTLPSTVTAIQKRHGLAVARQRETVSGWEGCPTVVSRYWLEPGEREKARELLAGGAR